MAINVGVDCSDFETTAGFWGEGSMWNNFKLHTQCKSLAKSVVVQMEFSEMMADSIKSTLSPYRESYK